MNKKGNSFIAFLLLMAIGALVGGVCWTYSINTILHLMGKPSTVKFWQGSLIGFVPYIGHLAIPVSVVVWIVSLIVGG